MTLNLPSLSNSIPKNTITLPCSKKTVQFRQFLVKEEKLLLMGAEKSSTTKDMTNVLSQVIESCCFDTVKVKDLPLFDLEYLFLQIRSKSVSEVVSVNIPCEECKTKASIEINIANLTPTIHENHENKVLLSEDPYVGICLTYPTIDVLEYFEDASKAFDVIISCIEYIYDRENIYYAKDYTLEEKTTFLEGLSQDQFMKINKFFETSPRIKKDIEFACKKCNHENKYTLKGLADFFI